MDRGAWQATYSPSHCKETQLGAHTHMEQFSSSFSDQWGMHPLPFVEVYSLLTSSLLQVLRLVIVK